MGIYALCNEVVGGWFWAYGGKWVYLNKEVSRACPLLIYGVEGVSTLSA